MLTRLRVSGFKNLVDVDVRFGPFTCVAGVNGVGKSNLFDAIHFLSALADRPLIDAALGVRDEGGRGADVRSLFHRIGEHADSRMSFEAEILVPESGRDDLGQDAKASITLLRYHLDLGLRTDEAVRTFGPLEVVKEELSHITIGDASKTLLFPHSATTWRRSAVKGQRRTPYFISTEGDGAGRVIKLHQDGGSSGRPLSRPAANLPRTVLSAVNAAESPTALIARREMQSWRLVQLEPTALRRPDDFTAPIHLGVDGSHLPSALYHLAHDLDRGDRRDGGIHDRQAFVYGQVARRLSELIEDVRDIWVDRDERRELLTLQVTDRQGTVHPARSLSDGTLRFLALTVLEREQEAPGLLCLEEPENGIHPARVPAILRLLQDIAVDADREVGPDNQLRQVIINTHSPSVVSNVPEDSLLVAELKETVKETGRFSSVHFSALPNTWRQRSPEARRPVQIGQLVTYLNPTASVKEGGSIGQPVVGTIPGTRISPSRLVKERSDLQLMLPLAGAPSE